MSAFPNEHEMSLSQMGEFSETTIKCGYEFVDGGTVLMIGPNLRFVINERSPGVHCLKAKVFEAAGFFALEICHGNTSKCTMSYSLTRRAIEAECARWNDWFEEVDTARTLHYYTECEVIETNNNTTHMKVLESGKVVVVDTFPTFILQEYHPLEIGDRFQLLKCLVDKYQVVDVGEDNPYGLISYTINETMSTLDLATGDIVEIDETEEFASVRAHVAINYNTSKSSGVNIYKDGDANRLYRLYPLTEDNAIRLAAKWNTMLDDMNVERKQMHQEGASSSFEQKNKKRKRK